jgi:hypothetical protein
MGIKAGGLHRGRLIGPCLTSKTRKRERRGGAAMGGGIEPA